MGNLVKALKIAANVAEIIVAGSVLWWQIGKEKIRHG